MKNYLYILAAVLTFTRCSSPLSDIAISDPSVITPNINLSISNTDYGVSSNVNIALNDKNGAFIELKEGNVTLNGKETSYSMTSYSNNMNLEEGMDCKVVITLADSTEYDNSVKMPAVFNKVDYPSKISQGDSFEVSWKDNYSGVSTVKFEIKDTSNLWITVFESDVTDSEVLIKNIDYPKFDISEGKINLSRKKKGSIAEGFSGGKINATTSYDRLITIK